MASQFTQEEIDALYAPFPLEAHTTREGHKNRAGTKIQWFSYVDRAAVQRRLEKLFPGEWSIDILETHRESDYVTVSLRLTIRGISRSCNGGQSLKFDKDTIDEDKEKGAWTEAFRRAASVWGIGLYLYEMDYAIWTDSYESGNWDQQRQRENDAKSKFAQWYSRQFSPNGSHPTPPTAPAPPAPSQNGNHDSGKVITWPSAEAINTVLTHMQRATGMFDMTLVEFARLAGIENADDLDAWKTFDSGKAAYEAAMKQFEAEQAPAAPAAPKAEEYHATVTEVSYHKNGSSGYLEFRAPGMPRTYGRTTSFKKMVGDEYYIANKFDDMESAAKLGKPQTIAPLLIEWEHKIAYNPDGSVKLDYMLVTKAQPVTREEKRRVS